MQYSLGYSMIRIAEEDSVFAVVETPPPPQINRGRASSYPQREETLRKDLKRSVRITQQNPHFHVNYE
jgi:hypothetical protein